MNEHLIGIDLGTINDFTSIGVVQRFGEEKRVRPTNGPFDYEERWQFKEYRLLHLERHLGEPYTEIVEHIYELMERPGLEGARIAVDGTGVGRPVIDLLIGQGLRNVTPIIITGGDSVSSEFVNGRKEYRVPKRDLVGTLQGASAEPAAQDPK